MEPDPVRKFKMVNIRKVERKAWALVNSPGNTGTETQVKQYVRSVGSLRMGGGVTPPLEILK